MHVGLALPMRAQCDVFGSQRICIELTNGLRCHGTLGEFVKTPDRFLLLRRVAQGPAGPAGPAGMGGMHGPCLAPARISVPYKALSRATRAVIVNLAAAGAAHARTHELAQAYWDWLHDPGPAGMQVYWRCVATVHRYLACSAGKRYYIGTHAMAEVDYNDLFDAHADASLPAARAGALCMLRLAMLTKRTSYIGELCIVAGPPGGAPGVPTFREDAVQYLSVDAVHRHHQDAVALYRTGVAFERWFHHSAYRPGQAFAMVLAGPAGIGTAKRKRGRTFSRWSRTASQLFDEFCAATAGAHEHVRQMLYDRKRRPRSMLKPVLRFFLYRALRSTRYTGVSLQKPDLAPTDRP